MEKPPSGMEDAGDAPLLVDLDPRSAAGLVLALLGLFLLFGVAGTARETLTWATIGTLLALALNPIVERIERGLRLRRGAAVAAVIALLVAAATIIVVLLGPHAIDEAAAFRRDLPEVLAELENLPVVGPTLERNDAAARIERFVDELPARLGADDDALESFTRSALGGALAAFATVLVTVVLLLDGERLLARLRLALPLSRRAQADRAGAIVYRTVGRYFAGSLLVAVLNGLGVLAVGLVVGVPLIPFAALWATLTNLIPQIGGFLGGSVFVLLAATQGVTEALVCLAWFLLYQQFENHVVTPTIVGEAVDLTPPVTMMAALVGGSAAGVPGALVAVPLVGVAKAIYRELRPARVAPRPPARRRVRNPHVRIRRGTTSLDR